MSDPKTNTQKAPVDQKQNAKPPVLPDTEFNKTWDQEKNYKFVKRFNDPRFGEITVVKNPSTNQILMVKEKMVSGKTEATNDIMHLKSRLELNHPNMMKMVNYTTSVKKELCSTHYLSRAFYEFPKSDIYKEINDRKKDLKEFNDKELTHMLYQTSFGLQNLHSKNVAHGDIRPQHIGYDKSLNQYQMLDRFADPTPLERCQTNNIVNNKPLYLGPQLYKKLKGADKKASYDAQKNDIYALGMSILHTGTLDSMQDNYLPNGTINMKKLEEHLQDFESKHAASNPLLCQTLRKMLSEEETERPDVNQLIDSLPPYDYFKQIESQGRVFGTNQAQGNVQSYNEQPTTSEQFNFDGRGQRTYQVQNAPNFEYKSKPQVNYVYSKQEPQTVTYSKPSNQTLYSQPVTQYSYSQPTQYSYSQPTKYTYSQPTQYTYSQPTQYTTTAPAQTRDYSYVAENKVESNPNTTYVSTQDYVTNTSNQRYSHSYVDNSRIQQPSERMVSYSRNVAPTEVYNTQYVSNQYTSPETGETRVIRDAPENKVYKAPSTTEVTTVRRSYVAAPESRIENRVYTSSIPENRTESRVYTNAPEYKTESRVYNSVPGYQNEVRYINSQSNIQYPNYNTSNNYVTEQRKSIRFLNSEQVRQPSNTNLEEKVEYRDYNSNVTPKIYSNVEVNKETNDAPVNTSEQVVKRRYIMRADGTVVELDANSEINTEEVMKQLQA